MPYTFKCPRRVARLEELRGEKAMAKNQKADVKNPNSPDYKADRDKRSNQMNPNNPAYEKSREQDREEEEDED